MGGRERQPTWQLVVAAARSLAADGEAEFSLSDLVAAVQRLDPGRDRGTIHPIVQGMTDNATGGPKSAGGKVLHRVARGRYRLIDPTLEVPVAPTLRPVARAPERTVERPAPRATGRRIGLVGCVSVKDTRPRPARDLYLSTLFRGRRRYVERTCSEWWILSAKHGLVHPESVLEPYDVSLVGATNDECRRWSNDVLNDIVRCIEPRAGDVFEMHAGSQYRDWGLAAGLEALGCSVDVPTKGLGIGQQLAFYTSVPDA